MNGLRLLETLLSMSLQITLLAGATWYLASRAGRSERGRDALWSSCLAAILLLAAGDFALPHLRLLPVAASQWVAAPDDLAERLSFLASAIGIVWGTGAMIGLARLALGILRGAQLLRQTKLIPGDQLPQPWGSLGLRTRETANVGSALRQRHGGVVRFLSTDRLIAPFCWQLQRATIVLPDAVLRFPPDELAAVIRHELAHVQLVHPLWLFVQRVAEALLWFHPAVRWSARRASEAREFSADAIAADTPAAAAALLRALLRLTSVRYERPSPWLANAATGEGGLLAQRANRLGAPEPQHGAKQRYSLSLLAPLALAAVTMVAVWIPVDASASARSLWSPWPAWSAQALQAVGIRARDYEIDAHRLQLHRHDT